MSRNPYWTTFLSLLAGLYLVACGVKGPPIPYVDVHKEQKPPETDKK